MISEEIKAIADSESLQTRGARHYEDVLNHTRNVALLEISYQLAVMNERNAAKDKAATEAMLGCRVPRPTEPVRP